MPAALPLATTAQAVVPLTNKAAVPLLFPQPKKTPIAAALPPTSTAQAVVPLSGRAVVPLGRYQRAVVLLKDALRSEEFRDFIDPKSAKDLKEQAVVLLVDQAVVLPEW